MGAAGRFYRPLAESLHTAGFAVVVADLRGTGDSTPRAGRSSHYGYADLSDDIGAVLDELKADYADRRIVLVGHSLGGQLGLLHLATTPGAPVDGIVLVAAAIPYWRSYPKQRPGRLGLHPADRRGRDVAAGLARLVVRRPAGPPGDDGLGAVGAHRPVPRRGRRRRRRHSSTPVLAISIDDDSFTPHGTVDHTVAKLRTAAVRRERIARIEAEGRPAHFAWVRAPEPVTTLIRDWFGTLPGHR